MSAFEKMKAALAPVGIYSDDAPVLDAELNAYASELERMYTDLDSMFRERFIATAEDVGLSEYEKLFGPVRTGESAENRRAMLQLRMNLGGGDFTPAGIRRALDSLGLQYTISEYPSLNRLTITATTDYSRAEQAFIRREVARIVPAHLEFQLTFNTLTWAQIDAMDKRFSELDGDDLTWRQIDERTY